MKCKHTHFPVGVGAVWFNSPASSPHFSSHVDILMHVVLSCTGFGSFPRVVSIFSVLCFRLKSIRHQCFSSSDEIPAEPEGETASCSITPTLVWIHPLERVSCFNLLMDCSPALSTDGEATGWCQWLVIRIISSLAFVSADDISRQRNNLSRIWFQQPPQPWQWWWPVSTDGEQRTDEAEMLRRCHSFTDTNIPWNTCFVLINASWLWMPLICIHFLWKTFQAVINRKWYI